MLGRMYINKVVPVAPRFVFIVPQVVTWIDIGISIGGFVAVMQKEHNQSLPTPYSHAGIAILFVIYLWVVGAFVFFWLRRIDYPSLERGIVDCVAICVPVLAIRIVYSHIFIITADMTWNAVKGDSTAYLIMTMLPEVAIVAITSAIITHISPLACEKRMEWTIAGVEEVRICRWSSDRTGLRTGNTMKCTRSSESALTMIWSGQ